MDIPRFAFSYLAKEKFLLFLTYFLFFISGFNSVINSYLFKLLIESPSQNTVIFFVLNRLFDSIIYQISYYLRSILSQNLRKRIIVDLVDISLDSNSDNSANIVSSNIEEFSRLILDLNRNIPDIFVSLISIISGSIIIFQISPLLVIIVFMMISTYIYRLMNDADVVSEYDKCNDIEKKISTTLFEIFENKITVKTCNSRKFELDNLSNHFDEFKSKIIDIDKIFINRDVKREGFFSLLFLISLLILISKEVSSVDIVFIIQIILSMINRITSLSDSFKYVSELYFKGQVLAKKLDIKREIKIDFEFEFEGKIEFANVSYGIIKDLNLIINPRTKIGFVGKSGCGKSTIIRLICGIIRPEKGTILIDDNDIRFMSVENICKNIGLISQKTELFTQSIDYNIRYNGSDNILQSRKSAKIDFEDNDHLSGGQEQRVNIARTFHRRVKLLLADEATSALDSENKKHINEELLKYDSLLIVSHSFEIMPHLDKIFVFDQGKKIQEGTDYSLSKQEGIYKDLKNEWCEKKH